jgi:hypothetical protein
MGWPKGATLFGSSDTEIYDPGPSGDACAGIPASDAGVNDLFDPSGKVLGTEKTSVRTLALLLPLRT